MKAFIHDDFLLRNRYAKDLYHSYAESMPVCDFHCHLLLTDSRYATRLSGDHYKWRAMRFAFVEETFITGSADPKDKFLTWAELLPGTPGNPFCHWPHLERARFFNTTKLLTRENAEYIRTYCNDQLEDTSFSVRNLVKRSNAACIAATDEPADTLEHHKKIHDEHFHLGKIYHSAGMMTLVTMRRMIPPVGVAIYAACSLLECLTGRYVKESSPFILAIIAEIILLTLFPRFVTWLPNVAYGG